MLPLVLVEGGLERVELSCIMRGYNASYGTTPRSGGQWTAGHLLTLTEAGGHTRTSPTERLSSTTTRTPARRMDKTTPSGPSPFPSAETMLESRCG